MPPLLLIVTLSLSSSATAVTMLLPVATLDDSVPVDAFKRAVAVRVTAFAVVDAARLPPLRRLFELSMVNHA